MRTNSGRRAAAAVLFSLLLSACSTWTVQTTPPHEVLEAHRQKVQVRTTNGRRQVLMFPEMRSDRVVGLVPVAKPVEGAVLHDRQFRQAFDTVSIPLADITVVALPKTSAARTAVLLAAMGGVLGTVMGAAGPSN